MEASLGIGPVRYRLRSKGKQSRGPRRIGDVVKGVKDRDRLPQRTNAVVQCAREPDSQGDHGWIMNRLPLEMR